MPCSPNNHTDSRSFHLEHPCNSYVPPAFLGKLQYLFISCLVSFPYYFATYFHFCSHFITPPKILSSPLFVSILFLKSSLDNFPEDVILKEMKAVFISLAIALVLIPGGLVSDEVYDATRVSPATREEVVAFLENDNTSNATYNILFYNCLSFAVDLWRNAYLAGLDAFLIVINRGALSHVAVGFYAEGTDMRIVEYWAREDGRQWFFIEPKDDVFWARGDSYDFLDKRNVEIITFLYGEDVFELWREVSHITLNKEALIRLYATIWLYKLKKSPSLL